MGSPFVDGSHEKDTRKHLAPLLQDLGQIDVFYHDSDHSFVHMMWEYTSVWPHLRAGGILLSDDIGWNRAFWDFARGVARPMVINESAGALRK